MPDCLFGAEWLPVVLLYDPEHGKREKPAQVTIKSFPLCERHKGRGRICLGDLISDSAFEKLAQSFVNAGFNRPKKNFTGIAFIRCHEAQQDPIAQFLDDRKLT